MRFKDVREDGMLESVSWERAYMFSIGSGTDPKWLEIKAEREAERVRGLLDGAQGFKGVKVTWPRNIAVFSDPDSAVMGKKALDAVGIMTGDILIAKVLPDLKRIEIKKKWEDKR